MTLAIYKDVGYGFERTRLVRYTLFVDGQYLMHYSIESLTDKNEKEIIQMLRRKVLSQPYIKSILNPSKIKYMPQGELVHEENNTKLLKELEIKLRIKQIEEDFK